MPLSLDQIRTQLALDYDQLPTADDGAGAILLAVKGAHEALTPLETQASDAENQLLWWLQLNRAMHLLHKQAIISTGENAHINDRENHKTKYYLLVAGVIFSSFAIAALASLSGVGDASGIYKNDSFFDNTILAVGPDMNWDMSWIGIKSDMNWGGFCSFLSNLLVNTEKAVAVAIAMNQARRALGFYFHNGRQGNGWKTSTQYSFRVVMTLLSAIIALVLSLHESNNWTFIIASFLSTATLSKTGGFLIADYLMDRCGKKPAVVGSHTISGENLVNEAEVSQDLVRRIIKLQRLLNQDPDNPKLIEFRGLSDTQLIKEILADEQLKNDMSAGRRQTRKAFPIVMVALTVWVLLGYSYTIGESVVKLAAKACDNPLHDGKLHNTWAQLGALLLGAAIFSPYLGSVMVQVKSFSEDVVDEHEKTGGGLTGAFRKPFYYGFNSKSWNKWSVATYLIATASSIYLANIAQVLVGGLFINIPIDVITGSTPVVKEGMMFFVLYITYLWNNNLLQTGRNWVMQKSYQAGDNKEHAAQIALYKQLEALPGKLGQLSTHERAMLLTLCTQKQEDETLLNKVTEAGKFEKGGKEMKRAKYMGQGSFFNDTDATDLDTSTERTSLLADVTEDRASQHRSIAGYRPTSAGA